MGVAYPFPAQDVDLPVRTARRTPRRQRLAGLVAALVLEALVVLALLTLGSGPVRGHGQGGRPAQDLRPCRALA